MKTKTKTKIKTKTKTKTKTNKTNKTTTKVPSSRPRPRPRTRTRPRPRSRRPRLHEFFYSIVFFSALFYACRENDHNSMSTELCMEPTCRRSIAARLLLRASS